MIISHKYKFIFIKNVKTAGTSIEIFLSQICGKDDIITPIYPHVEPHFARNYKGYWNPFPELYFYKLRGIKFEFKNFIKKIKFYNHIPALRIKNRISKHIWNDYYKFCVERNPFDKTLSHYHMINHNSDGNKTLEEYFKDRNFCVNYYRYADYNDNIFVDEVIKYESLIDELDVLFRRLGIPFNGSLGVKAKSSYRKDKKPYQEFFTKKQVNVIRKVFQKEIAIHNYQF